jgi:hypothetical protein
MLAELSKKRIEGSGSLPGQELGSDQDNILIL